MLRFRALLLWLMMVVVPFQGYAAAAMAFCAPSGEHAAQGVHEVVVPHSEISQGDSHDHPHRPAQHASDHGSSVQHDAAQGEVTHKCGTCAACHAFAITPCAAAVVLDDLPSADLADPSTFVAAASPRTPDKPPRG